MAGRGGALSDAALAPVIERAFRKGKPVALEDLRGIYRIGPPHDQAPADELDEYLDEAQLAALAPHTVATKAELRAMTDAAVAGGAEIVVFWGTSFIAKAESPAWGDILAVSKAVAPPR